MSAAALTLTEPLNTFVEDQVKSGLYPDRDAVIVVALERLREQTLDDDARMAALDASLQASLDSVRRGEGVEVTDVDAYFDDVMARALPR